MTVLSAGLRTTSRSRRNGCVRALTASLAVLALTLSACGGDDDDADNGADASSTQDASDDGATGGESGGDSGSSTDDPEVPVDIGASGTATFSSGDITVDAEITECMLAEPGVSFVAEGENAGFQVFSDGDGAVGVVVTGVVEWEGSGTATIDGGSVEINGSGAAQDDSAAIEDFTINADIDSC